MHEKPDERGHERAALGARLRRCLAASGYRVARSREAGICSLAVTGLGGSRYFYVLVRTVVVASTHRSRLAAMNSAKERA